MDRRVTCGLLLLCCGMSITWAATRPNAGAVGRNERCLQMFADLLADGVVGAPVDREREIEARIVVELCILSQNGTFSPDSFNAAHILLCTKEEEKEQKTRRTTKQTKQAYVFLVLCGAFSCERQSSLSIVNRSGSIGQVLLLVQFRSRVAHRPHIADEDAPARINPAENDVGLRLFEMNAVMRLCFNRKRKEKKGQRENR